jgi:hypothetical protein
MALARGGGTFTHRPYVDRFQRRARKTENVAFARLRQRQDFLRYRFDDDRRLAGIMKFFAG